MYFKYSRPPEDNCPPTAALRVLHAVLRADSAARVSATHMVPAPDRCGGVASILELTADSLRSACCVHVCRWHAVFVGEKAAARPLRAAVQCYKTVPMADGVAANRTHRDLII